MIPMDRLKEGSRFADPTEADWEESAPGFFIKTLFRDTDTGEFTALMRMDPGAYSPPHAHDQLEEIYILDGDFHDEEHTYTTGQYCQRAIGAMHTAGTKNGCTVLLVYRN